MAVPMLEAFAPAKLLIADKAYDADRLRTWLQDRGIEAVIRGGPSASSSGGRSCRRRQSRPKAARLLKTVVMVALEASLMVRLGQPIVDAVTPARAFEGVPRSLAIGPDLFLGRSAN